MVAKGLRELLERGEGTGVLDGPDVAIGTADHPVCGDRVQLSVRTAAGIVHEVRWQAVGCPASMAIAALTAQALVDVETVLAEAVLRRAIADKGGLARHERHAEAMVLRALQQALAG